MNGKSFKNTTKTLVLCQWHTNIGYYIGKLLKWHIFWNINTLSYLLAFLDTVPFYVLVNRMDKEGFIWIQSPRIGIGWIWIHYIIVQSLWYVNIDGDYMIGKPWSTILGILAPPLPSNYICHCKLLSWGWLFPQWYPQFQQCLESTMYAVMKRSSCFLILNFALKFWGLYQNVPYFGPGLMPFIIR